MAEIGAFTLLIVLYGLVSGRLEGSLVTPPMVFVAAGLVAGATGEVDFGFRIVESASGAESVETSESFVTLAEIALALVLFTDASRIDLRTLRGNAALPGRLLLIGFPLTVGFAGAVASGLFPGLDVWEAFLVAAILAPTDAALGQVVVTSSKLPARIRQGLNVESGLNDGLAVPLFTVFLALAVAEEKVGPRDVGREIAERVGYGALIGVGVALVGGRLLSRSTERGWTTRAFRQLAVAGMAAFAWWAAEEVGGSGFIAAFVGGLAVSYAMRDIGKAVVDFTEDSGQLLNLLIFFAFGALGWLVLGAATWEMVVYAILALTVLRMLPVALSLAFTSMRTSSVLFLGWFGPRGLASIILGLLVIVDEPDLGEGFTILVLMTVTVAVSVFAHGISAAPLTNRYARRVEDMHESAPEMLTVPAVVTRLGRGG